MTTREIVCAYLRHCEIEHVHCPEARAARVSLLDQFAAECSDRPVEELKPYHLTDFIEARSKWRSVATRRSRANYVRACFQWAADQERISRNPFLSVRYTDSERRPDLPDATLDLVARLANKRYESALRFLRLTGCRLSELCNALWPDVDLAKGVWTIPRHKSRRYTGKPKRVALVPEAVDLLLALPEPHQGPIFLNTRDTPWTRRTLGQHLRRLKIRHGIEGKATLHGIRHTFGTQAVANGAPIKLVAKQLGHSTVTVTERYYCDLDGEMDAVRDAASKGLPKKG